MYRCIQLSYRAREEKLKKELEDASAAKVSLVQ